MKKKKHNYFWASYADLMTSLFFLMVVLFIISIVELKLIGITPSEVRILKHERDSLMRLQSALVLRQKVYSKALDSIRFLANATQAHIDKINEINNATRNLNQQYFVYDSIFKKHKLNFDVRFRRDDDDIHSIPMSEIMKLLSVGRELQQFVHNARINTPEVQYVLIIEGQASRDGAEKMDYNYDLSYRRAKNLKKYWDSHGLLIDQGNCEVLISGSGDGRLSGTGLMREVIEEDNQRFLIHILPKPGKID